MTLTKLIMSTIKKNEDLVRNSKIGARNISCPSKLGFPCLIPSEVVSEVTLMPPVYHFLLVKVFFDAINCSITVSLIPFIKF